MSKIKEIEEFLNRESSILERGKRYKEDVGILLGMINYLKVHISYMKPIPTSSVSTEISLKLLQEIRALIHEYDKLPMVCEKGK